MTSTTAKMLTTSKMTFRAGAMPRRRTNRLMVPCPNQAAVSIAPLKYHSLRAIGLKVNRLITSVSVPMPYSTNPIAHRSRCIPPRWRYRL